MALNRFHWTEYHCTVILRRIPPLPVAFRFLLNARRHGALPSSVTASNSTACGAEWRAFASQTSAHYFLPRGNKIVVLGLITVKSGNLER